jgi:hypothetical protein
LSTAESFFCGWLLRKGHFKAQMNSLQPISFQGLKEMQSRLAAIPRAGHWQRPVRGDILSAMRASPP